MMDQMDLFQTELKEADVFEALMNPMSEIITRNNVSQEKLTCKPGKAYSSVWYDTQLAFRICCRGEHNYFGISDAYKEFIPNSLERYVTKDGRSDGFINYAFDPTYEGIMQFSAALCTCLDKAIDSVAKEFDCCSRYEECSNAKRCINPNPDLATVCGYRRIMKKGKNYYGENRNI